MRYTRVPMSIVAIMAIAVLCASGCSKPQTYGNFAQVNNSGLLQDCIASLVSTYPPAKTRLNMLHPVQDEWGATLVQRLRERGYGISEFSEYVRLEEEETPAGYAFAYVVDEFKQEHMLRVTFHIGSEIMSRSYLVTVRDGETTYAPQGTWSRKH